MIFRCFFPAFYGQCLIVEAWTNPSPGSILFLLGQHYFPFYSCSFIFIHKQCNDNLFRLRTWNYILSVASYQTSTPESQQTTVQYIALLDLENVYHRMGTYPLHGGVSIPYRVFQKELCPRKLNLFLFLYFSASQTGTVIFF